MALPLKSGADLYTQEIRRVALQNEGSDLAEFISGSIYFNTNADSNTSGRIRYRGLSAWHSVANLEDIVSLQSQIDSLASSELFTALEERVTTAEGDIDTLEGYFTDGVANNSLKLGGQLPTYYATASGLMALQEKVSAFLDGEVDSDGVLENLKEIQAFLDAYSDETSLSEIINEINDKIAVNAEDIEALESKATAVSFVQTLTSGKEIGSITIDGTSTKLYAPSSYSFSEITSKPTTLSGYGITDAYTATSVDSLLSGYLPLSGGTITGGIIFQSGTDNKIIFDNTDTETYYQQITFRQNGKQYGVLGTNTTDGSLHWNFYPILHSGNFNTYAPTLTGTGASGNWGIDISGSAKALRYYTNPTTDVFADYTDLYAIGLSVVINYSGASVGDIGAYESVLNVGYGTSRFGRFIFNRASYSDLLYWQSANDSADGWGLKRRIAFLDSTVKAATKLADNTAYTAWGQTFFENGVPKNVSGNLTIGNSVIYADSGTNLLDFSDGANLYLGYSLNNTGNSYLYGQKIYLRYGASRTTGLILNSSGNVTIGSSDLAGTGAKLYVNGHLYSSVMTLGNGFYLNRNYYSGTMTDSSLSGMRIVSGAAAVFFGFYDTTGTLTNSSILSLSGTKVSVGGSLSVSGSTTLSSSLSVSGLTSLASRVLIGGATDDGASPLQIGRIFSISSSGGIKISIPGTAGFARSLSIYNRALEESYYVSGVFGDANGLLWYYYGGSYSNAPLTIAPSSYVCVGYSDPNTATCKFNVKGTSYFSGVMTTASRLLVNNATDDGSTALQVNGDLHVSGNIVADGQVSAGGVAEEGGTSSGGGSSLERMTFAIPSGTTTFNCAHNLATREVTVNIYEAEAPYQQVLADVYLSDENTAQIVFGSATDVAHTVVVIG